MLVIYNNVYAKILITKFLFIILLTKFSNKIEFPIHLYMVICQVCNVSNSLKYPKSQIYGI